MKDDKAAFEKWWEDQAENKQLWIPRDAIWQYFQREFPREAVESAILATFGDLGYDGTPADFDQLSAEIGRLWNSVESLHEKTLTEIPDEVRERVRREGDVIAGVCSTCGGAGGKCTHPGCSVNPHQPFCAECCRKWQPCPDCTERPLSFEDATRRSRVSAEWAGQKCLKCGVVRWEAWGTKDICEHQFADRRERDRRKGGEEKKNDT